MKLYFANSSYKYGEIFDYKYRLTSNTAILYILYTFPIAFPIAHRTIAYKHYIAHVTLHINALHTRLYCTLGCSYNNVEIILNT